MPRAGVNFTRISADESRVEERKAVLSPPELPVVITRSLCLGSLLVRGQLESAIPLTCDPADGEAYAGLARRLSQWLNEQDFTAHFTLEELDALSEAPGKWSLARHLEHASRVEAIGVLLWALGIMARIPPYEEPFPEPDLEPLLGWPREALAHPTHPKLAGFPYHDGIRLASCLKPRSQEVIGSVRAAAECWHWRTQVAFFERAGTPPPPGQDYCVMVAIAAEEAHAAGVIARPVGEDFPLSGKPFGKVEVEVQERTAVFARARRLALDWLTGYATPWDNVPVACSQVA